MSKVHVFIGRLQPFHNGHKHIVDMALKEADKVIILIGSAGQSRSIRNPFLYSEREIMISEVYPKELAQQRLIIKSLYDDTYNDQAWATRVQTIVNGVVAQYGLPLDGKTEISLIGHNKDSTSYYLKMFPQWKTVSIDPILFEGKIIDATAIREQWFNPGHFTSILNLLPGNIFDYMNNYQFQQIYKDLLEEWKEIVAYKKSWETAPYPPTFVTVDSVVVQSGHICLIKRKDAPGKGLWALPGGFIKPEERLRTAALRELDEETQLTLSVNPDILEKSITRSHVFDHPQRSVRGRTITHAFLFELKESENGLPKVIGSDDAAEAKWVPLSEIKSVEMFEDHYHIIGYMLGL